MKTVSLCFLPLLALAGPPPLRHQVLLNGEWPQGGRVPVYEGVPMDKASYSRTVEVPAGWTGKTIQLEFENVAFIAEVYIGDEKVFEHVGAWNPFSVDVTKHVKPGSSFQLRVDVKGPKHSPIANAAGAPLWPVGGWFARSLGGICGDVWLRAYGPVAIQDAFIKTSVRSRRIEVEYTLKNNSAQARIVTVQGAASPAAGGPAEKTLVSPRVSLAPGETKTVTVSAAWKQPKLWWPDEPTLYHLPSQVIEAGKPLDEENRRFGFREISISGNRLLLNGVRANLFGDYQVFGDTWYTKPVIHTPQNWPATIDRIKAMNIRILRWHHNPVPSYLLDLADEKGLLICSEAANYARNFHKNTDQAKYIENTLKWIEPWIRAERNHPSIYMWNATNEMTYDFAGPFPIGEMKKFGLAIKRLDPTRPVGYDGDEGVPGELVDYHYPELYNREPVGSIYGWAHLVQRDRPTGSGEMLHTKSPLKEVQYAVARNTWWLGIWLRGLRYTDWTNVKPACYWFAEEDGFQGARAENLRNALSPVALFDKEYDDLGISPYVTELTPGGTIPPLMAGVPVTRTLILYNDDFRGSALTAEVEIRQAGASIAKARRDFTVAPGERVEFPCRFMVAGPAGSDVEFVLRAFKDGKPRFEEVRRFKAAGHHLPAKVDPALTLGQ